MLLNMYFISSVDNNQVGICLIIISTAAFPRLCMEEILMLGNTVACSWPYRKLK